MDIKVASSARQSSIVSRSWPLGARLCPLQRLLPTRVVCSFCLAEIFVSSVISNFFKEPPWDFSFFLFNVEEILSGNA